jgi:hypothetical protein
MPFEFQLSCPEGAIFSPLAAEPLEDTEDFDYLVMQGCRVLAESGCEFHIGGFGSQDWKFDIAYDMSTLLEQLPQLIESLKLADAGEIDFYSQGVERTVTFSKADGNYEMHCHSRTSWHPSPSVETAKIVAMNEMIDDLAFNFSSALARASSEIADLEPFPAWRARS